MNDMVDTVIRLHPIYKCKNCGERVILSTQYSHFSIKGSTKAIIEDGGAVPIDIASNSPHILAPKHALHKCTERSGYGLCELVGFEV